MTEKIATIIRAERIRCANLPEFATYRTFPCSVVIPHDLIRTTAEKEAVCAALRADGCLAVCYGFRRSGVEFRFYSGR